MVLGVVIDPSRRAGTNAAFLETRISEQTTVEARVRVSAAAVVADSAGQVKPNPLAPGAAYATLATGQPDVAEALTILAAEHLGWVEMYKVFEIVQDSVKPTRLDQSGLLGQSRRAAGCRSAPSHPRPTDPTSVAAMRATHEWTARHLDAQ
jgi:hypothetical protein